MKKDLIKDIGYVSLMAMITSPILFMIYMSAYVLMAN